MIPKRFGQPWRFNFLCGFRNKNRGQNLLFAWKVFITLTSQWARWRLKSPASGLSTQLFIQVQIIKQKHQSSASLAFVRYWPFVRGIHRSPVNSPHKGQWRGAFMFSLICAWINRWVNNREAGDLRRYRAHYDVIVMYHELCAQFWVDFSSFLVDLCDYYAHTPKKYCKYYVAIVWSKITLKHKDEICWYLTTEYTKRGLMYTLHHVIHFRGGITNLVGSKSRKY